MSDGPKMHVLDADLHTTDAGDRPRLRPPVEDGERGRTALAGNPDGDKSGTHWQDWEIGGLLQMALLGKPWEYIGSTMHRTGRAAERHFWRLVEGEADCPEHYARTLADCREKFSTRQRGRPNSALDHITEQYRNLARQLEALEEAAVEARAERILRFAILVALGQVTAAEVLSRMGAQMALAIQRLAADLDGPSIVRYRQRLAELATPAIGEPAPQPPPLVVTGPGGDFTRAYDARSAPPPGVEVKA